MVASTTGAAPSAHAPLDLRQQPLDPAVAVKVSSGLTQTPQTHATLPPVENLYTPMEGFVQSRFGMAVEGMANPDNSFLQRVGYGVLGAAMMPAALIESVGTSLYNAPNNAALAGQHLARASLTEDKHEAAIDVLNAVVHGSAGIVGMGGVLAPVGARAAPGLPPAAPVVRPPVAQTADALAEATISANPARGNPAAIVRFADEVVEVKILEIPPGKFDYIFGRVSSNHHNSARSAQLATEMKRLGVADDDVGRQLLTEHMTRSVNTQGNIVKTYSNKYGNSEARESFFIGPSGKAVKFESHFMIFEDGTRSLTTVIPFN